jgi:hypothetical protein
MDASNRDALSAVVTRQRGRARLRSATVALGAASLIVAGAVAYTLPSGTAHTASTTSAAGTAAATGTTTVHATSGGSGVAAATSSGTGSASAPAAATGASHATSGGS